MNCFNRNSEFLPIMSKPLCQECGFCYYFRDFFSCFHYNIDNKKYNHKQVKQRQVLQSPSNKKTFKTWIHIILISTLTRPDLEKVTAVILIDESLRDKLGKLHTLKLIQQITSQSMNCYIDGITKGTPDNDVNNIFYSYVNIPDLI